MSEHYLQPEVHVVITQVPGVDGISSPARLTQIEADLAAVLGRPNIASLDDVPGVDVGSASDGDALVYHAATDEWTAELVQSGLTRVRDWDTDIGDGPYPSLQTVPPVYASQHPGDPSVFRIGVNVGTTANTVATGDHSHIQPLPVLVSNPPSGYISGGSQPLGSTDITVTAGKPYVLEAEVYGQFRGADSGAAYYTISLNIDGSTLTSPAGMDGFWCVQGVPDKFYWQDSRRRTGTGSAVTVSASVAWHSGSGFNIDRTYLKVRVRPDR